MQTLCPACGSPVAQLARFCQTCGATLPRIATSEATGLQGMGAPAERRQLTVVFCDVVGSTAISDRLDPEEVRELMHAYHEVCAEVIRHHEGYVAQYLGDGVLTYFGYPHAHEDAAVRAVRAALEIVETVAGVPLPGAGEDEGLRVRIGIHTGLVVVGDHDAAGMAVPLAFGGAPNLAARVQNFAEPGTVVVSEMTHHLVRPYFEFRGLGYHSLKGVATPLQMYEVIGESGIETRIEASLKTGLIPLVARVPELAALTAGWEAAKKGEGRAVLLTGDAGIGKSRLLRALQERIDVDTPARVECRCSPQHQHSAFYPLLGYFQRSLQLGRDDTPVEKLRKLAESVERYESRTEDTLPLLAALLSLPHPEGAPPLLLTPQSQKLRTLDTLVGWILDTAGRQPTYVELEDLHWSDPSTLELVDLLIERCAGDRIFFVASSRDRTHAARWLGRPQFQVVDLERLEPAEATELVEQVAGGKSMPSEVSREIVTRTDGVPLFVEELTKMVLESRGVREGDDGYEVTRHLPDLAIPATLRDSLMARLDQHPSARQVAQLAATLGRELPVELIRAVSPLDGETLEAGLRVLLDADLLRYEGPGEEVYSFKHALIRDIAYESLLKRKRQQYHLRTAEVLESDFPDVVETEPEIVAHHYEAAGAAEQAIPYLQRAAHRAIGRSAYAEAASQLDRALELLERLAVSKDRSARELELRSTLGVVLTATEGYTSERVERNHSRAEHICRELDDVPQLFPSLYGLWAYHMLRNRRDTSFELAGRLEGLGASPDQRYMAASVRGVTLYWAGELVEADECLEVAEDLFDASHLVRLQELLGDDAPLLALLYHAWCLVDLGRFDAALRRLESVSTGGGRTETPYLHATRLVFEMLAHLNMGMLDSARDLAREVIALSTEQQFPWFLATANCAHGAALVRDRSHEQGVPILEQGLALFDAIGALTPRPYWQCELAQGRLAEGRTDEALAIADAALEVCRTGLSQTSVADLHTLRGRCLVAQGAKPREVERCFLRAIEVARSQGGPTYELRATRELCWLLDAEGRRDEARERLRAVRGLFSGVATVPELTQADQLLEALG